MLSITADPRLAMRAPFIAAWMAVIVLVAWAPELVLWLPRLMRAVAPALEAGGWPGAGLGTTSPRQSADHSAPATVMRNCA